ncbi:C4-dicarboxylate ABC transporter permease [Notoacmeibacter marinus]|uniref:TRAP transporter large permease protein n=1 Tax=Notoacmeibacter marinus TaxID=1876515 RepID=A0A231V3P1_9HYPH|nr:TRAP transporter large permease [Notoacmeibacter marinus]OXT02176.1 C4-dicarboxylate ABC transporter permease [Notoacmeibacter marinus]
MYGLLTIGSFMGMLAAGMPIFLSLGVLSLILIYSEGTPLIAYPQIFVDHLESDTLVAIPFFVLAATFMQRGGIAKALVECATVWIGSLRGGLALVCVAATTIFAAISGSSIATAMAMGTLLVPAMVERSYSRPFALGVVGASGTLGILIPPSLPMIVYAVIAEESIPRLFLAGVVPGLLQAALFSIWIIFFTWRKGYPSEERVNAPVFISTNLQALPALSLPVIILGGIYSGIVTVSESAGLAALVSIIVALFVYKGCTIRDLPEIVGHSVRTTASIIFIVMTAGAFAHWIVGSGVSDNLVDFVENSQLKAWQFLLFINILLLALGMFLEVFAVILITMPIVLPLLGPLGINPIHFAIVLMVNMEVALLTPPIGMNLYVLSTITSSRIADVIRGVGPFVVIMLILLLLVTFVPEISLFLPGYIFG